MRCFSGRHRGRTYACGRYCNPKSAANFWGLLHQSKTLTSSQQECLCFHSARLAQQVQQTKRLVVIHLGTWYGSQWSHQSWQAAA
jgi:hypothetical protein